jgi:hypothetical protein
MPPLWQLYRLRAGRAVRVEIYRNEHRAREAAGLRVGDVAGGLSGSGERP